MSTGLILIITGIIIGGVAFLFAIGNMARGISSPYTFDRMFRGQLGAMGAMVIGGVIAMIGVVMVGADFFQKL